MQITISKCNKTAVCHYDWIFWGNDDKTKKKKQQISWSRIGERDTERSKGTYIYALKMWESIELSNGTEMCVVIFRSLVQLNANAIVLCEKQAK